MVNAQAYTEIETRRTPLQCIETMEATLGIECIQRERVDAVGELIDDVLRMNVTGLEAQRLQRRLGDELHHYGWENRVGLKNLQVRPPPYDVSYISTVVVVIDAKALDGGGE
jgi:hypothetical protein